MKRSPRFLICLAVFGVSLPVYADYPAEVLADAPIAYWRLDADASDTSPFARPAGAVDGSAGDVTFGVASLLPSEPNNGAVELSGDSAGQRRIIIPGFEKVGADGWTAESWVKVTQMPGPGNCCDNLVGDGESGGDFHMMNYLIDSPQGDTGAIRPHFFGTGTVSLTTTNPNVLEVGNTYHVVTTWDRVAGTGNIYVNGVLWLSGAVSGNPVNTDNPIFIGRDNRENRPSNFIIDEVALYDYPLTLDRIAAHFAEGTGGVIPPQNYEEEVLFDNPRAYWRFNESDGPTTADFSGNGRDATASGVVFGAATLVPPDVESAILFQTDGQVASAGFAKSGTGTSLDFWVKFNAAPAGGAFTNLVGDGEAAGDFHLMVQAGGNGIIRARVQTDAGTVSVDSTESLLDERQHHIVVTWEAASGDLLLYIDNALAGTANQAGNAVNTDNPIFVGRDGIEPGLFDGVIDEVAVYDFPLAPDRIAARFNRVDVPPPPPPPPPPVVNGAYANAVLADGPVAYWRLGEPDGTIVYDRSGNNHHGAQDGIVDSITYGGASLVPAEAADGSISLAGFDRLIFPGFEKVGAEGWSAEYWVVVTQFPGAGNCCDNFVGDGESGGDFHMMNYLIDDPQGDQGAIRPHFNGTSTIALTTTVPNVLELDTLYHVVTNWDRTAGTGNIYVNGNLWLSGAVTGNPVNTDNPIYIGRDGRENRPSNFMIDEVAMYDYALTAEQILNHYNTGISAKPPRVNLTEVSHDPGTGELTIRWESVGGKLYNLRSEADPSQGEPIDWPLFGGNENMAATPPENTLTFPLPAEAERFFVIEEFNAPPVTLFSDDLEGGQGAWTLGSDGTAGTDWQLGTPSVVGPLAANSGANCFGTNIGADYGSDANVWLRSPAIDLTTAGAATLHYAQFRDIEQMFDSGSVSVLDAANDSLLIELEAGIEGTSPDWEDVTKILPAEALGKLIKIEFRFQSDNFGNFAGWYVDDVVVTVP